MSRLALPVSRRDHILGRPEAPVVLVEYMDYQCPFSARAHAMITDVLSWAGEIVQYVPRHFPLSRIHPHAIMAAQAAEAAGAQRRFWPMHATLLENQDALDFDSLVIYARALGLDVERVVRELRTGVHMQKVQEDFGSGVRSDVTETPSLFLDGFGVGPGWDAASLLDAVHRAAQQPPSPPGEQERHPDR